MVSSKIVDVKVIKVGPETTKAKNERKNSI